MKLHLKILLVNLTIVVAFELLFSIKGGFSAANFGILCLLGALITTVFGLITLLQEDKRISQGFLMSGGILILLGYVACSHS